MHAVMVFEFICRLATAKLFLGLATAKLFLGLATAKLFLGLVTAMLAESQSALLLCVCMYM